MSNPAPSRGQRLWHARFCSADKTQANSPRYITFKRAARLSAEVSNGEFNIGFNPFTHRIMVMNVAPSGSHSAECHSQAECCEALWEDKSPSTQTSLLSIDPLDRQKPAARSFRTIQRVRLSSTPSDNDGDPGGLRLSAGRNSLLAVPNGGADHETLAQVIPGRAQCVINDNRLITASRSTMFTGHRWSCPHAIAVTHRARVGFGGSCLHGQGSGSCGGLHGRHVAPWHLRGCCWNQCGGCKRRVQH